MRIESDLRLISTRRVRSCDYFPFFKGLGKAWIGPRKDSIDFSQVLPVWVPRCTHTRARTHIPTLRKNQLNEFVYPYVRLFLPDHPSCIPRKWFTAILLCGWIKKNIRPLYIKRSIKYKTWYLQQMKRAWTYMYIPRKNDPCLYFSLRAEVCQCE